jgi:hypothetical protein
MKGLSLPDSATLPSLEAFAEAAQASPDVSVDIAGERLRVLGRGSTPGGRSVTWLAPHVDTTSMFAQMLERTYGHGIAAAVKRELELDASPGKPLLSRSVLAALDMAATASQALAGVDFVTRLSTSAVGNTPMFQQTCQDCGIDAANVSAEQRQAIDLAMQTRFEKAAAGGQTPVPLSTATTWLQELLQHR